MYIFLKIIQQINKSIKSLVKFTLTSLLALKIQLITLQFSFVEKGGN